MARFLYGGGGDGDIIKPTGVPYINSAALVYNARAGGTQVTDLQDITGASVWQVTSDSNGQVIFYGPDAYIGVLWLDFGSGVRWALSPKAVDLAAARAITVQRAADAAAPSYTPKTHLPYNVKDPLEQMLTTALDPLVIPRFASFTDRDAAFPAPVNGDRCYRTDLTSDQVYNGVVWITVNPVADDWVLDTYTITPASGTFSIGSGQLGIRYRRDGKLVTFYLWAVFASDTVYGTGTWTITGLPFTLSASAVPFNHFYGHAISSAGRFVLSGQAQTNGIDPYAVTSTTNNSLSQIGASPVPGGGTWGASNVIRLTGVSELA